MPLTDQTEANVLDSVAVYGTTRYLHLLEWSGAANTVPDPVLNGDGSLVTNIAEPSTGGYAPHQAVSTEWKAAVGGAPTLKQWPKDGQTGVTFTPTGGASWQICGYAWCTNATTISAGGNVISFGVMLDGNGDPTVVTVDGTHPLTFSSTFPIVERLGAPPQGVDPT